MARINCTLAKSLVLYLALLPVLGMPAEIQAAQHPVESQRPVDPPQPGDPPRPVDPPGVGARPGTVFTPASNPVTIQALNGLSANATSGLFRHEGHGHAGGVAAIESPWGEQLSIRYWLTPHGVTFEYDEELKVRYRFDQSGTLDEIVAETPDREARMAVGNRAELAYLGQRDFNTFDLSAYEVIEEAMRAKHSDAFLASLQEFDGATEVSCGTQGIQCVACILAWAVTVGAIASACIVGGVPTFGAACFLAILAHEATNFSCAATCIEWAQDCFGGAPDGDGRIIEGCEP